MFFSLRERLAAAIAEAAGVSAEEANRSVELPKGQFGDIASSVCFLLAKERKRSPAELARQIAAGISLPSWVERVQATGPYLNFFLSEEFYAELLREVAKKRGEWGRGGWQEGKTIVEFPSVNPNKPWHIGHLRNALLGDAVARILEFSGAEVERIDYIDDLGLQVAQSYWGYKSLGEKPRGKLDLWLGKQYVEVSRRFEQDGQVQRQVREILRKMEEGAGKEAQECRKLVEECVRAQYETAFKFGIWHDALIFESDIVREIFGEGIEKLKKNGAIVKETEGKNAGCFVAKMKGAEFAEMESPDKVLIRSDGTATYTGKDVIFQLWKFGLLKNDFSYCRFMLQPNGKECLMSCAKGRKGRYGKAGRVVNVIGMEQAYPQKVISEILRSMGYERQAQNSIHLAYEHVWLEDEKFSGRQGTWIGYTADELYEEGVKRAMERVKEGAEAEERRKIAQAVAAGAIRFSFLRTTPEKKIIFNWDDALSLEGDSAPYVIYAHARAHKIFEKGGAGKAQRMALGEAERGLLKQIMLFEWAVQQAALHLRPHILCEYCLDLAALYNKFYNSCPVLSCEDEKAKGNRLAINFASLCTLKNALCLLGIEALERM
ncbi:MAG: arginine--tRNA ligase [Candidatus Micrarchaeota archaeon]|nr:arginine--tRNA ligase [Candidatus Micrarchaeota archaeon]